MLFLWGLGIGIVCVANRKRLLMQQRHQKAMTLPEVLIAFVILAVGLSALVALYSTSSASVTKSRQMLLATKDANTVLEHIQSTSLSTVKLYKSDDDYWNKLLSDSLINESVTVYNVNTTDTSWSNNPLELAVQVSWQVGASQQNVTIVSKFTE